MRSWVRTLAIFAFAGLASAAAAQDKTSIEALNARFAEAYNKGDMVAVSQFYTEAAVLLPPGSPIVKGRAAIQSYWTLAAKGVGDLRLMTDEVRPLGEAAATEIGRFSLKTKTTPAFEMGGKYVVVWRREGDGWKLDTDIWNADK